jgi:hypothetical protein
MPRRLPSRRTIGVLAAVLLATAVAALLAPGPRATPLQASAEAASPLPPTPAGTLLARMRIVLPTLVLNDAEARALDFKIQSNTFDNRYPPEPAATFRMPLPGQTPNSPMMTEFFAGGFVLGKAENLQGRSRPGNVTVVLWAFSRPEGAFRSLRALRDLSGLHAAPSSFAPGAVLLSLPGTGVSDLLWVRGRALVRATSGVAEGGKSMVRARERVARAIDAKISAEPYVGGIELQPPPRPDLSTLGGRLGALRIAENDLPGSLDTRSWQVRARPDARERLGNDPAAARLGRRYRALGLLGAATQVISIAQIHGTYVTYAWAFPTARAARAALRTTASQRGVRAAQEHAVRAATRVVRPGKRLRDDLFWVHGKLLLQVGAYGPPGIPLLHSRQDVLAARLDANASALG